MTVQIATTTTLDVSMQLREASQTVTVSANASQLQPNTSDVTSHVQTQLVENLPLEVGGTIRNPVQFISLVPGFVGDVGNNPGSNNTDDYKLNGGQEGGTDILMDGVSIRLRARSGAASLSRWSLPTPSRIKASRRRRCRSSRCFKATFPPNTASPETPS